jgi:hypothetical protein
MNHGTELSMKKYRKSWKYRKGIIRNSSTVGNTSKYLSGITKKLEVPGRNYNEKLNNLKWVEEI